MFDDKPSASSDELADGLLLVAGGLTTWTRRLRRVAGHLPDLGVGDAQAPAPAAEVARERAEAIAARLDREIRALEEAARWLEASPAQPLGANRPSETSPETSRSGSGSRPRLPTR